MPEFYGHDGSKLGYSLDVRKKTNCSLVKETSGTLGLCVSFLLIDAGRVLFLRISPFLVFFFPFLLLLAESRAETDHICDT